MDFQVFLDKLLSGAIDLSLRLLGALAILILGRILIKFLMRTLKKSRALSHLDPAVAQFLLQAIRLSLNVLLTLSVVALLGVPMTSALALIASAGVAVGLALQGALGNLAGGIMILIFRPFHLEDFIELGSFSGTVTDIGFFYTTLRATDNRVVTIPNGTVMGAEIVNFSAAPTRRVDMVFSVPYSSSPDVVREVLLSVARAHPLVLSDPPIFCRLLEQGEDGLHFTLRTWVQKNDYWSVKFDLLEAAHARLSALGFSPPYRQVDVHLERSEDLGRGGVS